MPDNVEANTNGSAADGKVPSHIKKSSVDNVLALVNQSHLRFAWFLGNLGVVLSTAFYLLNFRHNGWLNYVLFKLIFVAALATFGIVLYQNRATLYSNKRLQVRALLQDDNAHYFYNALIWLLLPRQSSLAIISYVSFSTFHVLTFLGNDLFPALNLSPKISNRITRFTKEQHELSRLVAAHSELLLLIVLIFRSFLFKKLSWASLVLYAIFIKIKSEGSIITKSILKNWEVRVDGLVSSPKAPPAAKSTWVTFKRGLKTINKVSIIRPLEEKVDDKK